tara:strand:+ start:340 stop:552 length:213 start_codon:yes stop_codon:yes gene_type:complete
MEDSDFIDFQDDFYDLLVKYGVSEYYCMTSSEGQDQDMFQKVCSVRDNLVNFIDKLKRVETKDLQENGQR